jgi:hypothetical protein
MTFAIVRYAEMGQSCVSSLKTSLGRRNALQQVSPFMCFKGAFVPQGGSETAERFLKCRRLSLTKLISRWPRSSPM